jgi:1,4-dihydroxy-2-naphthoate octaprenyltransferase
VSMTRTRASGSERIAGRMATRVPRWRAWLLASRPKTLPVAVAPVLAGLGVAHATGPLDLGLVAVTLVTALLLQIGANFANDVGDFLRGVDRSGRIGPLRVTQAGLLPPRTVAWGAAVTFAAAEVGALIMGARTGPAIPVVCLLAIAAAVLYSNGPWPYGAHGLGDAFVFLFFGVAAVLGTVYAQGRPLGGSALAAAVAVGLLADAVLVVNNLRDIQHDRMAARNTLAVALGPAATRVHYACLVTLAEALPLADRSGWFWLPWLTLPMAAGLVRTVARRRGAALNPALGQTALLLVAFAALFAAGRFIA